MVWMLYIIKNLKCNTNILMEKNKRSRKGRGRKKKPKSSTAKKTPKKWQITMLVQTH